MFTEVASKDRPVGFQPLIRLLNSVRQMPGGGIAPSMLDLRVARVRCQRTSVFRSFGATLVTRRLTAFTGVGGYNPHPPRGADATPGQQAPSYRAEPGMHSDTSDFDTGGWTKAFSSLRFFRPARQLPLSEFEFGVYNEGWVRSRYGCCGPRLLYREGWLRGKRPETDIAPSPLPLFLERRGVATHAPWGVPI